MSISARVDAPARIRRATAISLALALVLVSQEWLAGPAGAAAGDLDRTFGNDGIVRSTPSSGSRPTSSSIRQGQYCPVKDAAVRIQSDGAVVAAGGGFLARFGPRGGRDRTFGGDGIVKLPGGNANRLDDVGGLHIAADGTILVAGEETDSWILARYELDGSLDPTFAGGGSTRVPLLCQDIVDGLAVQRNHRVVVVGGTYNCTENGRFHPAIVRLTPRGVLDSSFGDRGTTITTGTGFASGVAIQRGAPTASWWPGGRVHTPPPSGRRSSPNGIGRSDSDGGAGALAGYKPARRRSPVTFFST